MARSIRTRPESVLVAVLLSAVGGYLDAFTFLWKGVFANAQSGNVVLVAVDCAQGLWRPALLRLPAMAAFVVGLLAAQLLATRRAREVLRRPTRWVLGAEIVVLLVAGVLPAGVPAWLVAAVVSFVAALQVSTFKTVGDIGYNTTMATGNVRALVAEAFGAVADHDDRGRRRAVVLAAVLLAFAAGAAGGALVTRSVHGLASWGAALLLAMTLAVVVTETHRIEAPDEAADERR